MATAEDSETLMGTELEQVAGSVTLHTGAMFAVRKTGTVQGIRYSLSLSPNSSTATEEELRKIADMIERVLRS